MISKLAHIKAMNFRLVACSLDIQFESTLPTTKISDYFVVVFLFAQLFNKNVQRVLRPLLHLLAIALVVLKMAR